MIRLKNKAQNLSEYAIMLGVVIGAVLLSQDLIKKALTNKFKDSANSLAATKGSIAGEVAFGGSTEYDPYEQRASTDSTYEATEDIGQGGAASYGSESRTDTTSVKKKNF